MSLRLNDTDRAQLLRVARESIKTGLLSGRPSPVNPAEYSETLQREGAAFVTLHKHGDLRGCIGSLEPHRPLVLDVAEHAFDAAFRDPRFPPVTKHELPDIALHIAVLTPMEPIPCDSEEDLLRKVRPGQDGLVIQEGEHRGTFLPAVWETLPEPRRFLKHLKQKAGLPQDYWSDTLVFYRYETIAIDEAA